MPYDADKGNCCLNWNQSNARMHIEESRTAFARQCCLASGSTSSLQQRMEGSYSISTMEVTEHRIPSEGPRPEEANVTQQPPQQERQDEKLSHDGTYQQILQALRSFLVERGTQSLVNIQSRATVLPGSSNGPRYDGHI